MTNKKTKQSRRRKKLFLAILMALCNFVESFSNVLIKYSSCPNNSNISSLEESPKARSNVVTGTFLVLSILTYKIPLASNSYSSHVPLLGLTSLVIMFLPLFSTSFL